MGSSPISCIEKSGWFSHFFNVVLLLLAVLQLFAAKISQYRDIRDCCLPNVVFAYQATAYSSTRSFLTCSRKCSSLGICAFCSSELIVITSTGLPNAVSNAQYTSANWSRLLTAVPVVSMRRPISLAFLSEISFSLYPVLHRNATVSLSGSSCPEIRIPTSDPDRNSNCAWNRR